MPLSFDQMLGKGSKADAGKGMSLDQMLGKNPPPPPAGEGTPPRTFIDKTVEPKDKKPTDFEGFKKVVTSPIHTVAGVPLETLGDITSMMEPMFHKTSIGGLADQAKGSFEGLKSLVSDMVDKPLSTGAEFIKSNLLNPINYLFAVGHLKGGKVTAEGGPKVGGDEVLARLKALKDAAGTTEKPIEAPKGPTPARAAADLKAHDAQMGAEQEAYRLVQKGGYGSILKGKGDVSPAQIESIRKKNPAVGKALDEIMARRNRIISAFKDTHQGEWLGSRASPPA